MTGFKGRRMTPELARAIELLSQSRIELEQELAREAAMDEVKKPKGWRVSTDPHDLEAPDCVGIRDAQSHLIADVYSQNDEQNTYDNFANASLIATAPSLLSAVKLALLEFERISYQIKADPTI